MKRLKIDMEKTSTITMMVPTIGKRKDPDVFKKMLKDKPEFSGVQVTWLDEFIGMEADVLIWLGDSFCYNTMPCQFTRVSGKLVLVCLPQKGSEPGSMVEIMREACLGEGTAKWAPEQENVGDPISIIQMCNTLFQSFRCAIPPY